MTNRPQDAEFQNSFDLPSAKEAEYEVQRVPPAHIGLRLGVMLAGAGAIIMALAADQLGYGVPGEFGSGQALLMLFGAGAVAGALLGTKAKSAYVGASIIVMNTILLMAAIELSAIIISRTGLMTNPRDQLFRAYLNLPYYRGQTWSEALWAEARLVESYEYEPYIIWRHQPFSGETINVDSLGRRVTPGADCRPGAYLVYALGGSTMWGWGSPDWETIPAHLQAGLDAMRDEPVCVVNLGEDGYISTQSLLRLLSQLQAGERPDVVIFYSGINDVYAAFATGRAGVPYALNELEARFEGLEPPLVAWLRSSRAFTLANAWLRQDPAFQGGALGEEHSSDRASILRTADHIREIYLETFQIVAGLGNAYHFEFYFFWQPNLAVDPKSLTPEEVQMRADLDPVLVELAVATYEPMRQLALTRERLWYLGDIFERERSQIWIDSAGHITPEGNRLISEAMLNALQVDAVHD